MGLKVKQHLQDEFTDLPYAYKAEMSKDEPGKIIYSVINTVTGNIMFTDLKYSPYTGEELSCVIEKSPVEFQLSDGGNFVVKFSVDVDTTLFPVETDLFNKSMLAAGIEHIRDEFYLSYRIKDL